MSTKKPVSYRVIVTWRNNCATAIVHRDTGSFTRKVGRVSWKCESQEKSVLAPQAADRAAEIILADQRKRGVRPQVIPFPRL